MTVTSSQLTVKTEMSSSERLDDSGRFINATKYGPLEEVIELSSEFSVEVLSDALIGSCGSGHLDVVKWLGGHTTADVNYNKEEL